jgi:hypothetical protein
VSNARKGINLPSELTPKAIAKTTSPSTIEVPSTIDFEHFAPDSNQISTSIVSKTPKYELKYLEKPEVKIAKNKPEDVPQTRKTSAISVVSLGLSLASYVLLFGGLATSVGSLVLITILGGLITGIIGLTKTGKQKKKGKGFAISGVVLSSILIILIGFVVALFASFS